VRVWDVASGTVLASLEHPYGWVGPVVFAEGGTILASGGSDETIRLWDVNTWKELDILRGHSHVVCSLTVSPDGKLLVSGSGDHAVKLWSASANPAVGSSLMLKGVQGLGWGLSPDGCWYVATLTNHTYSVWETATLRKTVSDQTLPCTNLSCVAIATNGQLLAFGRTDGRITICGDSPYELPWLQNATGSVWGLAFSRDGSKLAALFEDRSVAVWWTTSGKRVIAFAGPPFVRQSGYGLPVLVFSPDGRFLAASHDGATSLFLWDFASSQNNVLSTPTGVLGCAFSWDSKRLATAGGGDAVLLWDLHRPREPAASLPYPGDMTSAVAFSPDDRRLAVFQDQVNSLRIWDTRTLLEVARFRNQFSVFAMAFLADDNTLVAAGPEGLRLWRADSFHK
jgi:WD40 repeat protein